MKILAVILIYIFLFMVFFFILSLVGILWMDYKQVISNKDWFAAYSILIGWWLAAVPTVEIYEEFD